MNPLIVLLRAAQLFAHAAHNAVTGPAFFGDHAFFGDSYEAFEGAYDGAVELSLADGEVLDFTRIGLDAAMLAASMPVSGSAEALFRTQLQLEERLRESIGELVEEADDAGQSFLQKLAEDSKVRTYKIRQRLA